MGSGLISRRVSDVAVWPTADRRFAAEVTLKGVHSLSELIEDVRQIEHVANGSEDSESGGGVLGLVVG